MIHKSSIYIWDIIPLDTSVVSLFFLKILFIIFRERVKEGERETCVRETAIGCLSHISSSGPGVQARHGP